VELAQIFVGKDVDFLGRVVLDDVSEIVSSFSVPNVVNAILDSPESTLAVEAKSNNISGSIGVDDGIGAI